MIESEINNVCDKFKTIPQHLDSISSEGSTFESLFNELGIRIK